MRLIAIVLVAIGLSLFAWRVHRQQLQGNVSAADPSVLGIAGMDEARLARGSAGPAPADAFRCDGRVHCSQMQSCGEAKYFLQNCPGTKMDGDGDGIPCESQWCE